MSEYTAVNEEHVDVPVDATPLVDDTQADQSKWQMQAPVEPIVESGPLPWPNHAEVVELQARWNAIQVEFVDSPQKSVEQADALVADTLSRIEKAFANQHNSLNEQWSQHEDVSTDGLRVSLQAYRSFLNRLLAL